MALMYCNTCGNGVSDKDIVCGKCGSRQVGAKNVGVKSVEEGGRKADRSKVKNFVQSVAGVTFVVVYFGGMLAVFLGMVYLAVKFIRWAWFN